MVFFFFRSIKLINRSRFPIYHNTITKRDKNHEMIRHYVHRIQFSSVARESFSRHAARVVLQYSKQVTTTCRVVRVMRLRDSTGSVGKKKRDAIRKFVSRDRRLRPQKLKPVKKKIVLSYQSLWLQISHFFFRDLLRHMITIYNAL